MEVDAAEPDDGLVSSSQPAGRGRIRTIATVVLVVLPALVGLAVWLWAQSRQADMRAERDADRAVLNAATRQVIAFKSVDYQNIDEHFAAVEEGATGEFLEQFQAFEKQLRAALEKSRSVEVPSIPKDGVALVERGEDTARVIVIVNSTLTTASSPEPQPRHVRIGLTLERHGDEWLTSELGPTG